MKRSIALVLTCLYCIIFYQIAYAEDSFDLQLSSCSHTFESTIVDAADCGNLQELETIIMSGHDVNTKGKYETTALIRAVARNRIAAVRMLLRYKANPNLADIGGATPLHIASRLGLREITEILLSNGASLDTRDINTRTPLENAKVFGHDEIVQILQSYASLSVYQETASEIQIYKEIEDLPWLENNKEIEGLPWLVQEEPDELMSISTNPIESIQEEGSSKSGVASDNASLKTDTKTKSKTSKRKLIVLEAQKVEDENLIYTTPQQKYIAITGFKEVKEIKDCSIYLLGQNRGKLINSIYHPQNFKIYITPFVNKEEAEIWCHQLNLTFFNLQCNFYD